MSTEYAVSGYTETVGWALPTTIGSIWWAVPTLPIVQAVPSAPLPQAKRGENEDAMLQQRTIVGIEDGPHLLVTAGVHGDEYEPMLAVRRLAERIDQTQLRGRLTLVPVVNEPAFKRARRTAEDELDLARTCPGRDDGSITERIAAALSKLIRSADFYIDLHTGGAAFQILPLAGYGLHRDSQVLDRQRQMAAAFNLPIIWGTNARNEGRSLSVARDAGVPAIYVEHGGGGGCHTFRADECVTGCLNVCRSCGLLDGPSPENRVRYVVEDDRDESGHLQVQHPAPMTGFFEPLVALGDVVTEGQLLGRVVDALGQHTAEVRANDAGIVLLLRAIPSVQERDALVALLPIVGPGRACYARMPAE